MGKRYQSLRQKLSTYKRIEGNCWLWTGACQASGHGVVRHEGKTLRVHRVSYCLHHGINSDDLKELVLHIVECPHPNCFNPVHLYLGDGKQNIADMLIVGSHTNKNKTHCPAGHEYTIENTTIYKDQRYCKICHKEHSKQWARRQKYPKDVEIAYIEKQELDNS
jgi:hypothetical protein